MPDALEGESESHYEAVQSPPGLENWLHSDDEEEEEEPYKEDLLIKTIFTGVHSWKDCAKMTLLGWSYGVAVVVSLIMNIVLFSLAISYYAKRTPEPDSLVALNIIMTILLIFEVILRAFATRHAPCSGCKVLEYCLALICLTALFTYLIDTDDLDGVFETAVLAFRSVTVLCRIGMGLSNVKTYSENKQASSYSRVDFDLVQDVQVTDEEHGVISYE
mmetsp:Transcript_7885/g.10826  ORF Transcript_7885/g.10826 Transcript_7885/m.10826 type:complete len:218 (+) Transcript_7885:149-802(+)|eukprot:CAMPEP_0185252270 /NCGR_PEP_ID=MMETSP1359-20130426/1416_1 /TAXON_ID=552665 /ORGANISM="Bigelowiella longifila, Strain CCMP242" /LENGTH=217 /DNA_ID=CAMNT_0027834397 /DNA_START=106 /DNA_END=759 /DNA_ORIENTATION=+